MSHCECDDVGVGGGEAGGTLVDAVICGSLGALARGKRETDQLWSGLFFVFRDRGRFAPTHPRPAYLHCTALLSARASAA